MLKKTLETKYSARDAALSTVRQLLCTKTDLKEIYYDVGPTVPEGHPTAGDEQLPANPSLETASMTSIQILSNVIPSFDQNTPQIDDVPVTVIEIITSMLALTLKKATGGISPAASIKSLSAGKFLY
jgi:hypothetical protein